MTQFLFDGLEIQKGSETSDWSLALKALVEKWSSNVEISRDEPFPHPYPYIIDHIYSPRVFPRRPSFSELYMKDMQELAKRLPHPVLLPPLDRQDVIKVVKERDASQRDDIVDAVFDVAYHQITAPLIDLGE